MRPRIAVAKFLVRAGELLRTLPVVVLPPSDMVEWSRQKYERGAGAYATGNYLDEGLTDDELELLERVPGRTGRVLILGGGGGREALWFAQKGWQVAAVDFSAQMLEQTRESMARQHFAFDGWLGDIARLEAPHESFDLVWISMFLYSTVLNRTRRIEMLKRIRDALKPGGVLIVSFHWQPDAHCSPKGVLVRKLVAWLTLGNIRYENGDMLFGTLEFRHAFSREDELCAEFRAGGFETLGGTPIIFDGVGRGGAVLRKRRA